MKNHVLRPLFVVLGIVALILLARMFIVPKDFGIGERGYMYGWHREGNEEDWKKVQGQVPGHGVLQGLPRQELHSIKKTPHQIILCEDCHGPAGHPKGSSITIRQKAEARHRQEQGAVSPVPFPAALSHQRAVEDQGHRSGQAQSRTSNAPPVITRTIRWRA